MVGVVSSHPFLGSSRGDRRARRWKCWSQGAEICSPKEFKGVRKGGNLGRKVEGEGHNPLMFPHAPDRLLLGPWDGGVKVSAGASAWSPPEHGQPLGRGCCVPLSAGLGRAAGGRRGRWLVCPCRAAGLGSGRWRSQCARDRKRIVELKGKTPSISSREEALRKRITCSTFPGIIIFLYIVILLLYSYISFHFHI